MENLEKKNSQDWKLMDKFTLRVRGNSNDSADSNSVKPTNPVGLSHSILHVLKDNPDEYVKVKTVGNVALGIACKAFRIARDEIEKRNPGLRLVMTQSEYVAEINEKHTKGICIRIFAIPIKDAR